MKDKLEQADSKYYYFSSFITLVDIEFSFITSKILYCFFFFQDDLIEPKCLLYDDSPSKKR